MESSSASPSLLRVVLDTNVLVSGLLYGGLPKRVLRLALEGRFVAVTSRALQAELLRIFVRKFGLSQSEAAEAMASIRESFAWARPRTVLNLCRDAADNRVLECAVYGRAEVIVTGDRDLLSMRPLEGLEIRRRGNFLIAWMASWSDRRK